MSEPKYKVGQWVIIKSTGNQEEIKEVVENLFITMKDDTLVKEYGYSYHTHDNRNNNTNNIFDENELTSVEEKISDFLEIL